MGERKEIRNADEAKPRWGSALADKVAFLSRPEAYHDRPASVEAIETHMSWVFLSGLFAHKLKKPVRYEYLDFRTIDARRHFCEEEIRLNRRLAPDIYVSAVPLVIDPHGDLALDEPGEPVDWVVRMKRLPAERMLDRAILAGTVQAEDVANVAALLARFYADAVPVALPPAEYRRRLAESISAHRQVLMKTELGLPRALADRLSVQLRKMLLDRASLFDRRVRRGCVIEAHGDLRPEHVFLGPGPAVIDCLEFNRDFRIQDWLDELSFLAMECEMLGAPGIGESILHEVCTRLHDHPNPELVLWHKASRAMLRAKLAILHLQDDGVRDASRWRGRAKSYLRLAADYAARLG